MNISENIKNMAETVKPDSVSEIERLQQSNIPELQQAGELEADSKYKMAFLKNKGLSLIYNLVARKKAAHKISENLSMLEPDTAKRLSNKITRLVDVDIKLGSMPTLATASEALVYAQEDPDLSELFENLIVSSVDKKQENITHPAFVEILKQFSTNDGLYFKDLILRITDSSNPLSFGLPIVSFYKKFVSNGGRGIVRQNVLAPSEQFSDIPLISLENFERLKLITITYESYWTSEQHYKFAENTINHYKNFEKFEYDKGQLILTDFGKNFAKAIKLIES